MPSIPGHVDAVSTRYPSSSEKPYGNNSAYPDCSRTCVAEEWLDLCNYCMQEHTLNCKLEAQLCQ